jgi:hypothetical protein
MTDAKNDWTPAEREALEWHLASHFSGNSQPHMSGDPRARLNPGTKRRMDDAVDAALAALAPFVAAREAAAFKRGAEAMREACAQFHETRVAASLPRPDAPLSEAKIRGYVQPAWHRTSAQLIAVLTIPEDKP